MNYHNIYHADMKNGEGLRVVLFVSGCDRHCKGCQNPQTWNKESGLPFGESEVNEIMEQLEKPYTAGLTLVGGEPLMSYNREILLDLCKKVKHNYPSKTIWCYTGFKYEEVKDLEIMQYIDVLLDGEFIEELKEEKLPWVGSSNQRVIDMSKTKEAGKVELFV